MSVDRRGRATLAVTDGDSISEWMVGLYMKYGASWVEEEQALARAAVCDECPKLGKVLTPGLSRVTGCTVCGCFLSVKPKIFRYFDATTMKTKHATCPEGKWEPIDKNFNQ